MTEQKWVRITQCENIPLREGRTVKVGSFEIAVFNLGDRFLAVENRCPHQGGPLADGIVSGSTVVCPLHAWKINLECGSVVKPAESGACVRAFETRIENGVVLLNITDTQTKSEHSSIQQQPDIQQSTNESLSPSV